MLRAILLVFQLIILGLTEITREGLFQELIHHLSTTKKCFSNRELVSGYIDFLKKNSLEILKPRYLKNEMNDFLAKLDYEKSF